MCITYICFHLGSCGESMTCGSKFDDLTFPFVLYFCFFGLRDLRFFPCVWFICGVFLYTIKANMVFQWQVGVIGIKSNNLIPITHEALQMIHIHTRVCSKWMKSLTQGRLQVQLDQSVTSPRSMLWLVAVTQTASGVNGASAWGTLVLISDTVAPGTDR